MGYTTEFEGGFRITPPLTAKQTATLKRFAETRHCAGGKDDVRAYNDNSGYPGLWCHWTPSEDGALLGWDGGEKFYKYVEWLEYLVERFLKPWGRRIDGEVRYQGEESNDRGSIFAENNVVRRVPDEIRRASNPFPTRRR